MFGKLKEKLKGWIKKSKEEAGSEPKIEKTVRKKEKKKNEKEGVNIEEAQQIIEEADLKEKPKEKTSRSFFKKYLTNEKFEELFEELELILLQNNVALEVAESIRMSLGIKLIGKNIKEINLSEELKSTLEEILIDPPDFVKEIKETLEVKSPYVILFAGINGSGKTTTIAKVANLLQKNKMSVCLAAADTFRAASIEQIQEHANNLKIPLIKKDYGADPASIGFDAVAYAKKHKIDVVLIDTAGRLQNKDSLMKEIEKISRVNSANMRVFVGESITGNDCIEQAKTFNDSIALTGIILSKADVDEKGGTAISISHVTKKPILFLGNGQGYSDLEIFDKKKILDRLGL